MLSFAADFWPAFWAVMAVAALVTVGLCFAIALVPAGRPGQRHRQRYHQPLARPRRQVPGGPRRPGRGGTRAGGLRPA